MSLLRDPSRTLHGYCRFVRYLLCLLKHHQPNERQEYQSCSSAFCRCIYLGRIGFEPTSNRDPTLLTSVSMRLHQHRSSQEAYLKEHLNPLRLVRYRDHGRCLRRRLIYPCYQVQVLVHSKHEYCCYLLYVEYHPYTKQHNLDGFLKAVLQFRTLQLL